MSSRSSPCSCERSCSKALERDPAVKDYNHLSKLSSLTRKTLQTDSCAIAPSLWVRNAQGQECHFCVAPKRDDWSSSHFFLIFFTKSREKNGAFLVHTGPLQGSGELLPQQEDTQTGTRRRAAAAWTFLCPPLATLACRCSHRSRPACRQPGEGETCKTAAEQCPLAAFLASRAFRAYLERRPPLLSQLRLLANLTSLEKRRCNFGFVASVSRLPFLAFRPHPSLSVAPFRHLFLSPPIHRFELYPTLSL